MYGRDTIYSRIWAVYLGDAIYYLYPLLTGLLYAFGVISSFIVYAAYARLSFMIIDGRQPGITLVLPPASTLLRALFANILSTIITFLGLLLLIIPGLIFWVRFGFAFNLIVDRNMGALQSLRQSWDITAGSTVKLIMFHIIMTGAHYLIGVWINILSDTVTIANLLNVLATALIITPITSLTINYVYRSLYLRMTSPPTI